MAGSLVCDGGVTMVVSDGFEGELFSPISSTPEQQI
jgi:hypothetical protein